MANRTLEVGSLGVMSGRGRCENRGQGAKYFLSPSTLLSLLSSTPAPAQPQPCPASTLAAKPHRTPRPRRSTLVDPGYDYVMADPMSFNLYGYVRENPIKSLDLTGQSSILFNGATHTATLYDKNGYTVGRWRAGNRVRSSNPGGKWEDGRYTFKDTKRPHMHGNARDRHGTLRDSFAGSYGERGDFRVKGYIDSTGYAQNGQAFHSGRHNNPNSETDGCIRSLDEAMAAASLLAPIDPLTDLTVVNNRDRLDVFDPKFDNRSLSTAPLPYLPWNESSTGFLLNTGGDQFDEILNFQSTPESTELFDYFLNFVLLFPIG